MMRMLLVSILLICFHTPSSANLWDTIGIWDNPVNGWCYATIYPYTPRVIYIVALFDDLSSISRAHFNIDNYPGSPGYPLGLIEVIWHSDTVDGDLQTEINLHWNEPQSGPLVLLGTLEVLIFDPNWLGPDYYMQIGPISTHGYPKLYDQEGHEYHVCSGDFYINCSSYDCWCSCIPDAAEPSTWSQVKSIF